MKTEVLIVGGGIQGVGVAQAVVAAGYDAILVEKSQLAAGTSSRSSKLIHGGLRYLESAQFSLVRKSILERERLIQLAPGLIKPVPFYIPIYKNTSRKAWQIRLGLILYSLLGNLKRYARFKTVKISELHGLNSHELKTMFQYFDAQTDDAELTRAVMRSAQSLGAECICPAELIDVRKSTDKFIATINTEKESQEIECDVIVNATGPWANSVIKSIKGLSLSGVAYDCVQGTHIELDVASPEGVIYVEAPLDKRAVFIMPWHGHTLVGTTEKIYQGEVESVSASVEEVKYLESVYQHYFPDTKYNIINQFAGLRVLPVGSGSLFNRPRDTVIHEATSGFVTLYGGKLTSYRATSQQVIMILKKWLPARPMRADTRYLSLK